MIGYINILLSEEEFTITRFKYTFLDALSFYFGLQEIFLLVPGIFFWVVNYEYGLWQ